jgi:hypothetical protein
MIAGFQGVRGGPGVIRYPFGFISHLVTYLR